jgi:hypothetical protein
MPRKLSTPKKSPVNPRLLSYRIDASHCDLVVGSPVYPGMIVGTDPTSGDPIKATKHGVVVGLSFQGGSHTLEVFVRPAAAH